MVNMFQRILKQFPKLEFLCALTVAAVYTLCKEQFSIGNLKGYVIALRTKPEVPDELAFDRMTICRGCPLFYKPLQTCGSPLLKDSPSMNGRPFGCYCHMPTKSRTKANCWIYDTFSGAADGWKGAMNSFP